MEIYKQLSIFLENEPGALKRVLDAFAQHGVNIIANTVDNAIDWAVYRCVVTDPALATHLLGEAGTFVIETDVIGLTVDNTPGSLGAIAARLGESNINIDYAYGSALDGGGSSKALLILKPSNLDKAREVLSG